jgi:malate synthase
MEDAATAEISRSQVWQWLHNDVTLDTGEQVTRELVARVVEDECAALLDAGADSDLLGEARRLFEESATGEDYPAFLTLAAYESVLTDGG